MGNVRTRISRKTGVVRTTTSWGGKRGITTSMSTGCGSGVGRTRNTFSTNQKTGKTRQTQSIKVGPNSWYTTSKTLNPSKRGRKRRYKVKPGELLSLISNMFWISIIFLLILMVIA